MTKAEAQEALVTLYLRLNGYFTSGFIVHSPVFGANQTELDVLAVRFPFNAEPVRDVGVAAELGSWKAGIDFIIGEVKSRGQQLQFNDALRNSREAVSTILRWWGHLSDDECNQLIEPVLEILAPRPSEPSAPTVTCPRHARVRAILFSPERNGRRENQAWFIPGSPIFSFIWQCFRPPQPRPECTTTYDFGRWGRELEPIVRYFKDEARTEPGEFSTLMDYLHGNAR
jgi:hypothetical protein